jgi:hypothetical protein
MFLAPHETTYVSATQTRLARFTPQGNSMSNIPTWRFYQGLRNEWRWYKLGDTGAVIAGSDRPCAELHACMANAEHAGFDRHSSFQVHARGATDAARQHAFPEYLPQPSQTAVTHAP